MSDQKYPLNWPAGWRRTAALFRTDAKFVGKQAVYGVEGQPNRARERVTIGQGVERLTKQLRMLSGTAVTISSDLMLNKDGNIRRDQRTPSDPGVAVYWKGPKGEPRCMAIDQYTRMADNLAAIAATLEAMRAIDRYGGATIMERAFTGFKALTAPEQWWTILGCKQDANRLEIERAFRIKASEAHPDTGGTHDAMAKLNWARETGLAGLE